jgi:DNA-binding LacI/PurR family transcriptional regulator
LISKSDEIIAFITELIQHGKIQPGMVIPSLNETAKRFSVAKKTAVRAYSKLKQQGLIESKPKKGYYVISKKPTQKLKILLIVHSFDGHWEILYNSFREKVATTCDIEIYFHHYNIKVLELVVNRNVSEYDFFIISSFNHPRIKNVVGRIPAHKVLLISRNDRLDNSYNYIVQNFRQGTFYALSQAHNLILKYNKLVLSYPEKGGHSETLKEGFVNYCTDFSINGNIVNGIKENELEKNVAYLVISDADLIYLLKASKQHGWKIGVDIGVLSYNETPLKSVIRNGISVISCNFLMMAHEMAGFIYSQRAIQKVIPIEFIKRNSL